MGPHKFAEERKMARPLPPLVDDDVARTDACPPLGASARGFHDGLMQLPYPIATVERIMLGGT